MPSNKTEKFDYQRLTRSSGKNSEKSNDQGTLKPSIKLNPQNTDSATKNLIKQQDETKEIKVSLDLGINTKKNEQVRNEVPAIVKVNAEVEKRSVSDHKQNKKKKKLEKDRKLLNNDQWLARNGHTLTYVGLYLFSILVLFRPYELISSLSFLSATAYYFAAATILIFIPTQLVVEGRLTTLSTEVKAVMAMVLIALITIPIAKDPSVAWDTFNDPYIKTVLIFIVMINVLRTRRRLIEMLWLSLLIGVILSYMSLDMYMKGEMKVEGYRVGIDIGGMFANPNEMSLHLVMMIPLAVTLAIASKSKIMGFIYFAMAGFMLFANMITYSRGGFLALLASSVFLTWKLGRKKRIVTSLTAIIIGILVTLLAPGNFGLRVLSIFIPSLDPVGSSSQRQELLERSIIVTLRNPWGIGMGNFPIVGVQNLVSHNAYTQTSSELGLLGLTAYLIFIVSPFRKLAAIERTQFEKDELNWFYYMAIGFQTSIIAYAVASFFASVAYYWFVYYMIGYAVAFRRIYQVENNLSTELKAAPLLKREMA